MHLLQLEPIQIKIETSRSNWKPIELPQLNPFHCEFTPRGSHTMGFRLSQGTLWFAQNCLSNSFPKLPKTQLFKIWFWKSKFWSRTPFANPQFGYNSRFKSTHTPLARNVLFVDATLGLAHELHVVRGSERPGKASLMFLRGICEEIYLQAGTIRKRYTKQLTVNELEPITADPPLSLPHRFSSLEGKPLKIDGKPRNIEGNSRKIEGKSGNNYGKTLNFEGKPGNIDGKSTKIDSTRILQERDR